MGVHIFLDDFQNGHILYTDYSVDIDKLTSVGSPFDVHNIFQKWVEAINYSV